MTLASRIESTGESMNTLTLQGPPDKAVTVLSNDFLDNYMPKASGEFVKIYLYFLRYASCPNVGVSLASAADTFCITENDVLRALKYWEREGLVALGYRQGKLCAIRLDPSQPDQKRRELTQKSQETGAKASSPEEDLAMSADLIPLKEPDTDTPKAPEKKTNMYNGIPAYSAQDLDSFKKKNDSQLFFVIEQYLGKPLGPTDVNIIVFIGEQLGFSSELIEYLFEYCVSNNHYSIHYIEKTALAWAREGIDTVAKAKARSAYYNKTYFDILKAFGITNRNPAPSEAEHIRRWTREYGFPMPVILEACRRTIEATHSPSFAYAQSILERWYKNKVGSLEDVKRLDEEHTRKKQDKEKLAQEKQSQQEQKSASPKASGNKFHNFDQRSYDYSQLEQMLLGKTMRQPENGRS